MERLKGIFILVVVMFLLTPTLATAVPIFFEFEGNVTGVSPDVEPILQEGDPITGSLQFDIVPPDPLQFVAIDGSFTVPAGTVSPLSLVGSFGTTRDYRGPSIQSDTIGDTTYFLSSLSIDFGAAIFSAPVTLDDYLALETSDFGNGTLRGSILTDWGDGGGSSQSFMSQISYTSAGFRVATAPVPEPSTIVLMGLGIVGLAGFGRKKFRK
ncbi:MAG: PEP-CTERM sorting domain-containing protein [Desulfobacteraceae bacterium]|nr:PEP-CTERM sorting domain-containing protein [Desulfobacteraceae bacterium]